MTRKKQKVTCDFMGYGDTIVSACEKYSDAIEKLWKQYWRKQQEERCGTMTNEKAVKYTEQCIDRMRDCIDRHQKKGFPVGEMQETLEYYECVLEALKCEKKPTGDPLTPEQLRGKINEPVYLYIYDTALDSGWHIIKAVTDDKIIFRGWNTVYVPISSIGKCFDLYAYPPAHIDREAWVPCEWCVSCKNCKYDCDYDSDEALTGPCSDCDRGLNYSPVGFCQKCGRPLTEEAWAEMEEMEKRLRG